MTDRDLQLLTAFVDGELSNHEMKVLRQLLQSSSKARAVLAQLQQHAHSVKQLPPTKAPADFADQVMSALHDTTVANAGDTSTSLHPVLAPVSRSRRVPPLVWVSAAAILAMVSTSMFVLTNRRGEVKQSNAPVVVQKKSDEGIPLRDLQEKKQQELFAQELQRKPGIHLDLRVPDSARMTTRVQEALHKGGIQVVVAGAAKESLQRDGKQNYVVYLENVMPDEVAELLGRLAREESISSTGTLLVQAMNSEDRKLLGGLMGVEAKKFELKQSDRNLMLDFDPTTGNDKRPAANPSEARRQAVILLASSSEPNSPEVKNFLNQRRDVSPGTVQVLLMLHQDGV